MTDPYTTLGVAHGASPETCKIAFRTLAKTCHPDLHPNDAQAEARFKEINAAYEAIINPQPEPTFQTNNPFNFHFNFDPGNIHGGRSPFEDLFANLRGQQRNDITYEVRLTLEDVFHGKEISVQVPEQQQPKAGPRDLKVRIPPGIEDGMRLVVQQSHRQQPGVRVGDVHLLIRVLPHARFTRQGLNLLTVLPVTAFDILLGNEIEVVDLADHTIRVAIPSNFDSSRKLRLAGQGMVDAQGVRGDLLVDLFVQYPALPDVQRDALRRLAESIPSN